jgi:hypothetical protein
MSLVYSPGNLLRQREARSLADDADLLRQAPYGMVEIVDGQLQRIVLRRWPKLISLPEVWWLGSRYHERCAGDRCRLYYNQPRSCPNYLALKYVVSSRAATFSSLRRALAVLDEIAWLKQTDAIVCEAYNLRISDRLATRWGWERHYPTSRRRHFIKRFYGHYPGRDDPRPTALPK